MVRVVGSYETAVSLLDLVSFLKKLVFEKVENPASRKAHNLLSLCGSYTSIDVDFPSVPNLLTKFNPVPAQKSA
jgi:hypothetical protein